MRDDKLGDPFVRKWIKFSILMAFVWVMAVFWLVLITACNEMDHDVEGEVETTHTVSLDLAMCKEPGGYYRKECVDNFLEAWKTHNECEGKNEP